MSAPTASIPTSLVATLAAELAVRPPQVAAAIALFDEGATVPFVARYRKEATGGLDDGQLRTLEERLRYLRELEARRAVILESIATQGKLTDALHAAIATATDKTSLEDLYLPYKPKRRTKAMVAREAGLEPLARALLENPLLTPEEEAARYVSATPRTAEPDTVVPDVKAALDGARQILMEDFAEDAALVGRARTHLTEHALVSARVVAGQEEAGAKFADYFAYTEAWRAIPSHRALALLRGRQEGILTVRLHLPDEEEKPAWNAPFNAIERAIECAMAAHGGIADRGRPANRWLCETARWTWRVKLSLHLETEMMTALRERAEAEAIRVFGGNLKDLLMAAPAGPCVTMGLDPGLRTGVKVAVVDRTGKVLDTATVYPHEPRRDWTGSLAALGALAVKHGVTHIAIGNGTASRETDKLAAELVKSLPGRAPIKVVVSEAGASVYSASALAAQELPDLDVSLRGAVSIARRLQDPLAELVKIEPKSIGVGQYQHDVNQVQLARALDGVVEDCVNAVGVDVNTASPALLARVAGLSAGVAANLVAHRDRHGAFRTRTALKDVPRLGDKAFQQAAGFLRIPDGDNPLDASAVHPEAYPLVERILADLGEDVKSVMGRAALLRTLPPDRYADAAFGAPTVADILRELEKPGRDPRPAFVAARFQDGVETLADLVPGMVLEGVVTNVAAFGAFVDIGVHQDGLVHISALSDTFVRDPRTVVRAGQVVKVKVLEVDEKRRRIALTMRLNDTPGAAKSGGKPSSEKSSTKSSPPPRTRQTAAASSSPAPLTRMGEALAPLLRRKG